MKMVTRSRLIRASLMLVVCIILAAGNASANPLVITTTADANALVNAILGNGLSIVGTSTLIGTATQQGTFTGGAGILPFDSGIILTTGDARLAPGPNSSETRGTTSNTGSNAALTSAFGIATFDQNVLSLSFIPTADSVNLRIAFASDEYGEFVGGSVFDVFAFFLNGTNIAVLPDTNTAINSSTVNCSTNSAYYFANSATSPCFNPAATVNIQYDGLVGGGLNATSLIITGSVNAGVVNTLTIAIADGGTKAVDSALFIAANSFNDPPKAPEPSSLILIGSGLLLSALSSLRRKRS